MLAPWIIDQKDRERQRREDAASWQRQPRIEAPDSIPHAPPPATEREDEQGSARIDYSV